MADRTQPAPASASLASGTEVYGVQSAPVRVGVLDGESGFIRVLGKRINDCGWELRTLSRSVCAEDLISLRVNAVVIDPLALGDAGWEQLERVCAVDPGIAVVACSGPSTVAQRVRGLRLGADDWVNKPCHPEEVLARVEAVVRRTRASSRGTDSEQLFEGELEIRVSQFQAFVGDQSAGLTRREFELLHLLAADKDQVIPRADIYRRAWGYAMARGDRSVDVYVRRVRNKLARLSPHWQYIHTHFGVGYRFDAVLVEVEN